MAEVPKQSKVSKVKKAQKGSGEEMGERVRHNTCRFRSDRTKSFAFVPVAHTPPPTDVGMSSLQPEAPVISGQSDTPFSLIGLKRSSSAPCLSLGAGKDGARTSKHPLDLGGHQQRFDSGSNSGSRNTLEKEADEALSIVTSGVEAIEYDVLHEVPPREWFADAERGAAFEDAFLQAEERIHSNTIEKMSANQEVWDSVMSSVQFSCAVLDSDFQVRERQRKAKLEAKGGDTTNSSVEQGLATLRWSVLLSTYASSFRDKKRKEKVTKKFVELEKAEIQELETLDLSDHALQGFSHSFDSFKRLQKLFLHSNQLRELPSDIETLHDTLQVLVLSYNSLTYCPASIFSLTNLVDLRLNDNLIELISEDIAKLENLASLSLRSNRLSTLPESLGQLSGSLRKLYLHNNLLTTIPNCIFELTKLQTLMLHANNITHIRRSFDDLSNLEILTLYSNPLKRPHQHYVNAGVVRQEAFEVLSPYRPKKLAHVGSVAVPPSPILRVQSTDGDSREKGLARGTSGELEGDVSSMTTSHMIGPRDGDDWSWLMDCARVMHASESQSIPSMGTRLQPGTGKDGKKPKDKERGGRWKMRLDSLFTESKRGGSSKSLQKAEVDSGLQEEKDKLVRLLTAQHLFTMAHGQFLSARPLIQSEASLYHQWGLSSYRYAKLVEKDFQNFPFAFALSVFAGFLFERALALNLAQANVWKKWFRVIDTLVYLYPSNGQVKQMVRIFLASFRSVLLLPSTSNGVENESSGSVSTVASLVGTQDDTTDLADVLTLKPLIALALSKDLDARLKSQALGLMQSVASRGRTETIKDQALQSLRYVFPIVEQQEALKSGNKRIPYQRLPEKAKKLIIESKLPPNEVKANYDILLNCLSFLVHIPGLPVDGAENRSRKPVPLPSFINYVEVNPKTFFSNMTKIGSGAYGNVFLARPRSALYRYTKATKSSIPSKVAIKTCRCRRPSDFAYIKSEVELHREINHKNFVRYVDSFFYQNYVWIVMEYCDSGCLYDTLRRKPHYPVYPVIKEPYLAYVAFEVLEGLEYLHNCNRVHRDIKSDNILLDMSGGVKIADLGECTSLKTMETTMRMAGSRFWMAPEIILRQPYGTLADIYSFGALLMEMIDGDPPYWNHRSLKALFYTATYGPPPIRPNVLNTISDELHDLVKKCMCKNPNDRPSASTLLKHPFFEKRASRQEMQAYIQRMFLDTTMPRGGGASKKKKPQGVLSK
mmetsp:Transcript_19547/g.54983  ORF Transcript_19547/g.54983 Transcript_19547/m.54983 type:complete len:1223 (+) Transcript_19547:217-3885(+)